MRYAGIDVALKKHQYVAILTEENGSLFVHKIASHSDIAFTQDNTGLKAIARYLDNECPGVPIAIDAPKEPLRNCNNGNKCGRECERVLNKSGMHAYYTPCRQFFEEWNLQCPLRKPKKIKSHWMDVGFRLWNMLADRRLIEVHPHATFYTMLRTIDIDYPLYPKEPGATYAPAGEKRPVASQKRVIQAAALEQRKRLLAAYGIDLKEYSQSDSFDEIDAIAAAYTNFLYCNGMTKALGNAEEGQIVVPVLEVPSNHEYIQPILADYGYDNVIPEVTNRSSALASTKQHYAPNIIRVRNRDGSEEERLPNSEELEAIANCDLLKNPGKANIIFCCICGGMRVVNPQDYFQVKRCKACQGSRR